MLLTLPSMAMANCEGCAGNAQSPSPDVFIAQYARAHDFNGTILVQKDGRVSYAQSFGMANFTFGTPDTNQTVYKIASITKLFTSTLILQLQEAGRIDLNKTIASYLPNYRGEAATKVTIHQLLNHTSGLENIDTIPNIEDTNKAMAAEVEAAVKYGRLPVYQTPYTSDQLLEKFCSGPLVRPPGQAFDYNNADYIILGKIIEALYGKSYEEVLEERILHPLRMEHTGLIYQNKVIPHLADAYSLGKDGKALQNDMPVYPENWYAAGAMYSTADDLLKFSNALFGGKLLNDRSLTLMTTPGLDRYGYGLWSYETKVGERTYRVVKRPGRIMGARAELYRFLDSDLTVIILSNTGTTDLDSFVAEIGRSVVRYSSSTGK